MQSANYAFPNGSAWAAVLGAAIGCASFGLLVDLAEASKTCSKLLNFYNPSGDLSGKSTVAVAIWLISWFILHSCWKNKEIASPGWVITTSIGLLLLALLTTFPPIFTHLG